MVDSGRVKLFGESIEVRAEIRQLAGVSGHADNAGLIKWISSFDPKPAKVFVVHGEDTVTDTFAARLKDELGLDAVALATGLGWTVIVLFQLTVFALERRREGADN